MRRGWGGVGVLGDDVLECVSGPRVSLSSQSMRVMFSKLACCLGIFGLCGAMNSRVKSNKYYLPPVQPSATDKFFIPGLLQ